MPMKWEDVKTEEDLAVWEEESYSAFRQLEYPQIGEQLDLLWHAIDTDTLDKTSDFYTKLKEVKSKFPKG